MGALRQEYNPDDARKRSKVAWGGVVILALAAAWLLANLVPFFGDFVDLLGASVTPVSCWIIPIAMFLRYYHDSGEQRPRISAVEWAAIFVELALALVFMVLGTRSSMMTIAEHWQTYGMPFDCHCEGMWITCDCSGDHIGMD